MDTQEVTNANNEMRRLRAVEKLAKERADHIFDFLKFTEEFEQAVDNHNPQVEINLKRKRMNNARVRVMPWIKGQNV